MKLTLTLAQFDNRLMDGLLFCRKVYTLFEQIRTAPDGISRLRRLQDKMTKKLVEELFPIVRYVQVKYNEGRRIKVRWIDGGQQHDAVLVSTGALVEQGLAKQQQYLEVTTAVHKNAHLNRRLLDEQGHTFGVRGITVDRRTKKIRSKPHVYSGNEAEDYQIERIHKTILKKNKIAYPEDTVLIIQCYAERLVLEDDWSYFIKKAREVVSHHRFAEIFLFDSTRGFHGTIYARRQ